MCKMFMVESVQSKVLLILAIDEGRQDNIAQLFFMRLLEARIFFHYTKEQILHGHISTNSLILSSS